MKCRVHCIEANSDSMQEKLEQSINKLKGEVILLIPNVQKLSSLLEQNQKLISINSLKIQRIVAYLLLTMIDKNRIFVIDNKRIAFFLIFVSMFILTEMGRKIYRPYIYSNDIFDYWIADTVGNLTGTIAIIFFDFAGVNPKHRQGRIFLIVITLGLIVYELLQYFSPRSILDWRDMIATLIAGLISWGIYELLLKRYPENEITPHNKRYSQ